MKQVYWIDRLALMLLHAQTLAEHGGLPGLPDQPALEAALARPRHVHSYRARADLASLAAAYAYGIVRNHPFNDGNKRAGFVAAGLVLSLNGFALNSNPIDATRLIMQLASGRLSEAALARWIRKHMTRQR